MAESTKELRVGRRQRFRLVARLVSVVRAWWRVVTPEKVEEKEVAHKEERARRAEMTNLVVRLARRPLKKDKGFWELKVIRRVSEMEHPELRRLLPTVYQALD